MPTQTTDLKQMTKVAERSEFTPPSAKPVEAKGNKVIVIYMGGDYFALENRCTSCGSELQDGKIAGGMITCARCKSMYYVRHGGVKKFPATQGLKVYELRYDDTSVYVGPEKQLKVKESKPVTKATPIKW